MTTKLSHPKHPHPSYTHTLTLVLSPLQSVLPQHEAKAEASLGLMEPSTYSSLLTRPLAKAKKEGEEAGREIKQRGREGERVEIRRDMK